METAERIGKTRLIDPGLVIEGSSLERVDFMDGVGDRGV